MEEMNQLQQLLAEAYKERDDSGLAAREAGNEVRALQQTVD